MRKITSKNPSYNQERTTRSNAYPASRMKAKTDITVAKAEPFAKSARRVNVQRRKKKGEISNHGNHSSTAPLTSTPTIP